MTEQNLTAAENQETGRKGVGLRAGDRVRVRRQRWVVTDLQAHEGCTLVTLAGLEPPHHETVKRVLVPFDSVEPLPSSQTPRLVRASTWRRAFRALIAIEGTAGTLRTAATARIDLLPHQIEPALAVIRGMGSRVLIADEVGLGKTVQAALIVAELRAKAAGPRVLVLTPAGLREQWQDELHDRFGLSLTLMDARALRRQQSRLPVGVNPWSTEELVVASIDFVKRPEILPALLSCRWDVVIVDEAHHAAEASDRHMGVARLCAAASYVILLTATPHNGNAGAFASLVALGQHGDQVLAFRRTRRDVGVSRRRHVHRLRVSLSAAERRMHGQLDGFLRAVERERGRSAAAVQLGAATLRKRALSSPFALERSVERRLEGLSSAPPGSGWQPFLPLADDEHDVADETPAWSLPSLADTGRERDLLTRLLTAARDAGRTETKLRALTRLLRRLREPAIVFTEYRDTLLHLRDVLGSDAPVIHGGLSRDERRRALERFARGSLLLATDAAGEGLNLQAHCRVVVNLELPWNPVRLEQRIGRVDRIGQVKHVHAFYLLARGTSEMRVLERLADRVTRAQQEAGAADPLSSSEQASTTAVPSTFINLRNEAAAEHSRLRTVRAISVRAASTRLAPLGRPTGGSTRPLTCFTRRRSARTLLGTRLLVVLETTLADGTGRVVASHATALLVPAREELGHALERVTTAGLHLIDPAFSDWLERSSAAHQAFWAARIRRETDIAAAMEASREPARQPGLFDRRGTSETLGAAALRSDRLDEIRQLIDHGRWASVLRLATPRLALILRR